MILNNIHIFKNTKKYKAQKKQDGYYFNGFEKFQSGLRKFPINDHPN